MRGASTPFCFRKMAEHSLEAGDQDDDLLVVTTQVREEDNQFQFARSLHVKLRARSIKTTLYVWLSAGAGGAERPREG